MTSPAMTSPTIAVTGATGQQGGAVARVLLERGAHVIALVRDPAKDAAGALAEAGAELRQADLTDLDAVTSALRGVDAAFVMATMTGPDGTDGEIRVGTTVADAVARAGVPFAVYSSVGGAERNTGIPHFESKRRIEEHFEGLDVHTSFVRPAYFMDNLTTGGSGPSHEDGTLVLRMAMPGDRPLQLVAVRDIAAVCAALLLDPADAPATIEIAGDELTGEQIAAAFGRRHERPARFEQVSPDVLPDDDLRAMFAWFTGPAAYDADFATTRALDPDVLTLDAFLAAHP